MLRGKQVRDNALNVSGKVISIALMLGYFSLLFSLLLLLLLLLLLPLLLLLFIRQKGTKRNERRDDEGSARGKQELNFIPGGITRK